ncbi:hypothetical protein V1509DRAFT_4356 [Lipomyces kononenkoae]
MRVYNMPSSGIILIILGVLFLLGQVSAYIHGTLCVIPVFFSYDTYFEGSIQTVEEEDGLLVYQDGANLTQMVVPNDLLTTDLDGSADVTTIFKVGKHTCRLHGQWSSQGDVPPNQPSLSTITCDNRVWKITSSDPEYKSLLITGNLHPTNPMDYNANFYNMFGKYCGSY